MGKGCWGLEGREMVPHARVGSSDGHSGGTEALLAGLGCEGIKQSPVPKVLVALLF